MQHHNENHGVSHESLHYKKTTIIIIIIGSLGIAPLSVPDGTPGALHKKALENKICHGENNQNSENKMLQVRTRLANPVTKNLKDEVKPQVKDDLY